MGGSTLRRVAFAAGLAIVVAATVSVMRSQCRWGTFAYTVFTGDESNQEDWRRDAAVLIEGEELLVTDDRAAWDVELSPDGDRIVVAKAVGGTDSEYDSPEMTGLVIHDVDGSSEADLGVTGSHAEWSPDGQEIAFMSGRAVKVVAVEDKLEREVFRLPPSDAVDPPYLNDIAWSADSGEIAVSVGDNKGTTVWTMNADGSHRSKALDVADDLLHDLEWSPDGAFAWAGNYKGVPSVMVAEPSGEIMQVEPNSTDPVWSKDGTRLAYVIGHEGHYPPRIVIGDERGRGEEAVPMPDDARGGGSLADWASC